MWPRLTQHLAAADPSNAGWQRDLFDSYWRMAAISEQTGQGDARQWWRKAYEQLAKTQLLLIDDLGLAPLADPERRDLLEILEDRYGRRATRVASPLPFDHWHQIIQDATFADAIMDRLVHNAHKITLKGASMRRTKKPGEANDNH